MSTKLIFGGLPEPLKDPILANFFASQANFQLKKKQAKNGFLGFSKNIHNIFFWRALPPQIEYILAPKAPLDKILDSVTKNGYL